MNFIKWLLGLIGIIAGVVIIVTSKMPVFLKFVIPILFSSFLVMFRIFRGPTAADRAVAADVLGILVIGLCAFFAIFTGKAWYMDIAIAWALQSFIGILALAKYLEGKDFDD